MGISLRFKVYLLLFLTLGTFALLGDHNRVIE
jgi:hypothetical protein